MSDGNSVFPVSTKIPINKYFLKTKQAVILLSFKSNDERTREINEKFAIFAFLKK
jgi:hypothetical protein